MKLSLRTKIVTLCLLGIFTCLEAEEVPFTIATGLYDETKSETLGLDYAEGTETVTIFAPTETTDKFSNGVVMTSFKGNLYCMWQSSAKDEDAVDTWVAYSRSTDGGKTWTAPMVLAETLENGYCSSGGWLATENILVAYINTWPGGLSPKGGYTRYITSEDGMNWSQPADVKMADGTTMNAVFEQDPHVLPDGRIVNSAHFQPGLKVYPIYTDDPLGVSGWKKGSFTYTANGDQSRELEPSLYQKADGTLVMVFRDQKSTYKKMAATSSDRGETWSKAVVTDFPDSRSKQSAGNLPDGTVYTASNPVNNKTRIPLALTLSKDGNHFDKAWLLRAGGSDLQPQRYEGTAKRACYSYPKSMIAGEYLYVAYATNKEDVEYTRVPLASIQMNAESISTMKQEGESVYVTDKTVLNVILPKSQAMHVGIYNVAGGCVANFKAQGRLASWNLTEIPMGIYIVRVRTVNGILVRKISLK